VREINPLFFIMLSLLFLFFLFFYFCCLLYNYVTICEFERKIVKEALTTGRLEATHDESFSKSLAKNKNKKISNLKPHGIAFANETSK
jgi:hypothetical protein